MPKQLTIPGTGRFGHGTIRSDEARRQIARMQRKAVMGAMEQTIQDRYNLLETEYRQRAERNAKLETEIDALHKQRIDNIQASLKLEGAMTTLVQLGAKQNMQAEAEKADAPGDAPIVEVVRG